jgi:hypothetical protein
MWRCSGRSVQSKKEGRNCERTYVGRQRRAQWRAIIELGEDYRALRCGMRTLDGLARKLPTHTVRSEAHIEYQQFSTLPTLAMRAAQLVRFSADNVFLEPSAGTGIIASLARPQMLPLANSTSWRQSVRAFWRPCSRKCRSPDTMAPGSALDHLLPGGRLIATMPDWWRGRNY